MFSMKMPWFLKCIGAFITAFVLLNSICLVYFNVAVHRPADTGATDYIWQQNKFYSSANEGFAFGVTDKNGYNNTDEQKGSQSVDILVMGSSHMEAFQVPQDANTTFLLNKYLRDGGLSDFAYNIGISGHDFLRCASNLPDAISTYKPIKYVVIETGGVRFNAPDVDAVLDGTFPRIPSSDEGLIGFLQRFPFLRLSYHQLQGFLGIDGGDNETPAAPQEATSSYADSLARLMQNTAATAKSASVRLVILYHPEISLNQDGSLYLHTIPDDLKLFSNVCRQNDILFIDMSEKFLSEYQTRCILPYGFSNTAVGVGHLNRDGHRMVAEMLYEAIISDGAGVKK